MPIIEGIRMAEILWKQCPNCDAPLSEPVAVGDSWQCDECGEEDERLPGRYDYTYLVNPWGPYREDDPEDQNAAPGARHWWYLGLRLINIIWRPK